MKKQYKIQLPKGKKVTRTNVDFENGVMTVNVELENRKEQKYELKDGDFIFVKSRLRPYITKYSFIGIFCNIIKDVGCTPILLMYASLKDDNRLVYGNSIEPYNNSEYIRPATEKEKKLLIDKLAEVGKRWNEKEKRIEDIEYIPDDGDIVHILYGDTHEEIAIFYYRLQYEVSLPYYIVVGREEDLLGHGYAYMLSKEEAGYKDIDESLRICKIMPATKKEKDMMLNHLASIGKRWNPETKSIEDVRWRANDGDHYYYLLFGDTDLLVTETTDIRMYKDDERYNSGNYFKTSEAAEKASEQIRETFQNSKAE